MSKAFDYAVRLLTGREHGACELANKLMRSGYSYEESSEVITKCQRLGLQNDERFVKSLCRSRIRQGYGPLKISQELQAKQIDRELLERVLGLEQDNWVTHAVAVWRKKYKNQDVMPFAELQKRQRFLLYRGFPADIIAAVTKTIRDQSGALMQDSE